MNYLFVLFAAVLLVTFGILLMYSLSGTPLESKDTSLSKSGTNKKDLVPFPKPDYQIKPFFRSMSTVISARSFNFDASKGRITLGNEPNMTKWNIDYPLNFTHARLGDTKIYKFNRPNSSDSSGFIVNDIDEQIASDNFSFKKIEFGMFF